MFITSSQAPLITEVSQTFSGWASRVIRLKGEQAVDSGPVPSSFFFWV